MTNEQVVLKQEETENLPPSTEVEEEIEKLNENEEIIKSEENVS